jgi:ABC-type polysaccharide/polyol phosphate transport system ATPase subunit
MEQTAISVQNISKKFRLFNSPKERLFEALHPFNKKYHKEFWALKDINFEIKKGATVGIVGRNGAGKSTLLQVLCSILRPTTGTVTVNGRVSALLSLGAGFNPEFTGRQNAIMNGALMGFSDKEMKKRLPEIEAFADIGEFIDQPFKIYSSGMGLRLAFACAINIDPDILIIDETLAVGDAKFQHKCFGKFLEFQNSGKTILFVSHDTNAIVKHCNCAILLEKGAVVENGRPNEVVNSYVDILEGRRGAGNLIYHLESQPQPSISSQADSNEAILDKFKLEIPSIDNCVNRNNYNKNEYRQGCTKAEIIDYLVVCGDKYDPITVNSGDFIKIYVKAKYHCAVERPHFGISLKTTDGLLVYALNSFFINADISPVKDSDVIVVSFSFRLNLSPGDFFFDLGLDEAVSAKEYISLNRRCDVIHLNVREKNWFHGIVDFEASFQEDTRNYNGHILNKVSQERQDNE